jgi:ubiquinone/menaquinone biosynthesis C-methylase UbiE
MTLSKFLARQLGNPSGIIGKFAAFAWNRRNAALNDAVFDMLALEPSDRVLEIGFGGGYLLGRMSMIVTDGLLAGVDVSPAMVALCENRFRTRIREGKLELKRAAAESLPYPPKSFSKVCSTNSIFYWQDVGRAISEIERVLKPGGILVLCFTSKDSLAKRNFARNIQLVEANEIQALLAAVEFQDIRTLRSADQYRRFICVTGKKSLEEFQDEMQPHLTPKA